MKTRVLTIVLLFLFVITGTHLSVEEKADSENHASSVKSNGSPSVPKDLTIKESSFCRSLKAGKYILPANHGSKEAGFYLKIENWK